MRSPADEAARVLLIEDEENLAAGIRFNLEAEGLDVDWIGDGEEALERIRDPSYQLVILDVMLPGVDGFTLCEEARRNGVDTPVLFLTAKAAVDDRIRGLEAGGVNSVRLRGGTKGDRHDECALRARRADRTDHAQPPGKTERAGRNPDVRVEGGAGDHRGRP